MSDREKIAEYIYTEKNKHLVRLPEAPRLPTWEELRSSNEHYHKALVERFLKQADHILAMIGE